MALLWQVDISYESRQVPMLQDIAKRHGDQAVLEALQRPLAAFSVPDCILQNNEVDSLLTAWKDDIRHHSNGAVCHAWTNLRFNFKTTQCKIVL